jgi:hypothetical protein
VGVAFRAVPGLGLPAVHESWLLLQPVMPLPPSFMPTEQTWSLGASAARSVQLGAGAGSLVDGVLGRAAVETWDGVSFFYAGPLGARAERSLLLGNVPTSLCVMGHYDLGDPRVAPGWVFRLMVAPRF